MFNLKIIRALLFDLGGVVIEIDFDRVFDSWSKHSSLNPEQIRDLFYFDEPYQQYERGEIDPEIYYKHIRSSLNLTATNKQIELGWNKIFSGEINHVVKHIIDIKDKIPCYAFTNTNRTHQNAWEICCPSIAILFKRVFSSWKLGLRKPDPAAFRAVLDSMQIDGKEVIFFDDTEENITAAESLGLQTQLVKSSRDITNVLSQLEEC
jgi:epoxide hydrolase-like predicted phosphatase